MSQDQEARHNWVKSILPQLTTPRTAQAPEFEGRQQNKRKASQAENRKAHS